MLVNTLLKSIAKLALSRLPQAAVAEVFAEVRLESRGWHRAAEADGGVLWSPSKRDAVILGVDAGGVYSEKEALWLVGTRDNAADGFCGVD